VDKKLVKKEEEIIKDKIIKRSAAGTKIFAETLGMVISLAVMIYLLPKLPFISENYRLWLPVGIYTEIIGYIFKVIKHSVHLNATKRFFEILNLIVSVYGIYYLIKIYPFDFGRVGFSETNGFVRFALIVAVFALLFAVLVNFFRIFLPGNKK